MWRFLNGTLNRKDIDISGQEILRIAVGYPSSQSSSRYTGIFNFGILCPFQIVYSVGYTSSQSSSRYIKAFHFGILRWFHLCEVHVVIHYHDLKKEVAKNVKSSMKTDTVDIFITGPFCNAKAGKSTWIAVFEDYGPEWTLNTQLIKGYIGLCYKKYNQNVTLPQWDIEQERYWRFVTRNSACSGSIHIKPIIKLIYQNIPFWNNLSVSDCLLGWIYIKPIIKPI